MTKKLASFVRGVERFNERLGEVSLWVVFAIIGILLFEAVSRYVLKAPHKWSLMLPAWIFGFYFFIGGGYTLLKDSHIRMDVFYSRWSPKRRAIFDAALFFLPVLYLGILIWRSSFWTRILIETGERFHVCLLPVWPYTAVMTAGAIIMLIQALAFFIRDLYTARGKTLP